VEEMGWGIPSWSFRLRHRWRTNDMTARTARIDEASPFSLVEEPSAPELETEGRVRYLVVSGRQDDDLWGPIGALWVSEDGRRGGFLVNPWALWEGSEVVRSYRGALERGWSPDTIYRYWRSEVWRGSYSVDHEREAETLILLSELVAVL
jgi:hypothetical protein